MSQQAQRTCTYRLWKCTTSPDSNLNTFLKHLFKRKAKAAHGGVYGLKSECTVFSSYKDKIYLKKKKALPANVI